MAGRRKAGQRKAPAAKTGRANKVAKPRRSRKPRVLADGCLFSAEVAAQIVGFAESGLPRKYCAAKMGIGERTLQRWVAKGRDNLEQVEDSQGETPIDDYGRFMMNLVQAEAYARGDLWETIKKAAGTKVKPKDWHAAAWILARLDHREFGQHHRLEAAVTDGQGHEVDAADIILEKLLEVKAKRERLIARGSGSAESAD